MMAALIFAKLVLLSLGGVICGDWQEVDTFREDVQKAAAFAIDRVNARVNSIYSEMITEIVKATVSKVEGHLFLKVLVECRG